jgi:tRNA synthetases class II (A)
MILPGGRVQGVPNNYETDLIRPILDAAAAAAGLDYGTAPESAQAALKVIGDHLRAVVYLLSDGVTPSNVGRGYVVRRLLRRVVMKVCGCVCVNICESRGGMRKLCKDASDGGAHNATREQIGRCTHSSACMCHMKHTPDQPSHPPLLSIKIYPAVPATGTSAGHCAGLYACTGRCCHSTVWWM